MFCYQILFRPIQVEQLKMKIFGHHPCYYVQNMNHLLVCGMLLRIISECASA